MAPPHFQSLRFKAEDAHLKLHVTQLHLKKQMLSNFSTLEQAENASQEQSEYVG